MSWKRYFTPVPTGSAQDGSYSPLGGSTNQGMGPAQANYSSYLPDVYVGSPNRVERYGQYNTMDNDSEVNAALDILAEFTTQKNTSNRSPFLMDFKSDATNTEVQTLKLYLQQWCKVQNFETKMFRILRNTFKYGDAFFIRDPETKKWHYIDPANVTKIIVNESEGKKPEQYVIKNVNLNFVSSVATTPLQTNGNVTGGGEGYMTGGSRGMTGAPNQALQGGRFAKGESEFAVDAEHIVHLSLSEGLDNNFPFGNSLLESIFKVYKQKELLEDAILIYRVQRAPERRVFYIDVGNMPTHKARAHLERIKSEIHQRRIPSKTGGGQNIVDSAYNPLSIMEDYFFAQTAEGRGSKVETLPGGENLGQIDDLKYFNDKMMRGLRVPPSYLGSMDSDGNGYNDGRVGTAFIQEFRFTKFCERLQALVCEDLDREFKMFMKHRGVLIESSLFDLKFNTPQNFGKYRQAEVDQVMMNVFTAIEGAEYISKRFAMKRFLGLTDEEVMQNEKLWNEEKGTGDPQGTDDLKSVGASVPGGDFEGGGDADFDETDQDDNEEGSVIDGSENSEEGEETPINV